jgi:hypothetical protein
MIMKKILWMIPALALASPVLATGVYEAHNKWPGMEREHNHGDCDHKECKAGDPVGVPEPGTAALLVLGIGGIIAATRRRR